MAEKDFVPKEETDEASVDTEVTEEQMKVVMEVFSKIGAKPKVSSTEEMVKWMSDYVQGIGLVKASEAASLPSETTVTESSVSTASAAPSPTVTSASTSTSSGTSTTTFAVSQPTSSTTGTLVATRKPWLVKFNGQSSEGYTLWRHQLRSLLVEHHNQSDIADAIRSSLQGRSGDIVARLGTAATVEDIVKKMDSIYGEVDAEEDLLHLFYGAKQDADESVAEWGCRLESILALLKKQGSLPRPENQMLRTMLWKGLRKDLRDLSGYKYDKIDDFDELRVVLRRIEKQQQDKPVEKKIVKTAPIKVAQNPDDDIRSMLRKLSAEVSSIKEAQTRSTPALKTDGRSGTTSDKKINTYHGGRGNNYSKNFINQPKHSTSSTSENDSKSTQHGQYKPSEQSQFRPRPPYNESTTRETPTCYRCGQQGHIAIGCRVRTDHLRKPQDF